MSPIGVRLSLDCKFIVVNQTISFPLLNDNEKNRGMPQLIQSQLRPIT